MIQFEYENEVYKIYNEVGNLYRLINGKIQIFFECEWKGGEYFKIKSLTYGGRTYRSSRYHYHYLPLIREATFKIWQEDGLFDYKNNKVISYGNYDFLY